MQRFRNILVYPAALRESDPSVATATDLAHRTGASLTIVTVVSPDGQLAGVRRRKRGARLHSLASRLRLDGLTVQSYVLSSSSPARAIAEHVNTHRIDLVIKTARSTGEPDARAFSSTAKELMRTCLCPVWTVRPPKDDTNRVIVAAVAPYHHDAASELRDRDVLDVAVQLVELRDAQLHIASVWTPFGAGLVNRGITQTELDDYTRTGELSARRELLSFLAPYDITGARIHVRAGRPGEIISAIASSLDAELVVVGSAGRRGIKRWLFGNTVETVLDDTDTAVLGVRDGGLFANRRVRA